MKSDFVNLMKREILLSLKNISLIFTFSTFFVISVLIFIFALGSNINEINNIYKPVVWVILIFSMMLISENFLYSDHNDGSLKEMQFLGYGIELIIFCKSLTMWIVIVIPTILLTPVFSIFFNLATSNSLYLLLNILFATPSLTLISLISSLFAIQLKRNKIIQFVIIFPFYIPIIIFTTSSNFSNFENNNNFLILIGIFFITLPLCLFTSRLIIKEINR